MSSQTLEMKVIGLAVKVSFDYQPSEPASYDYPGAAEEFNFWELLVKDAKGVYQDCSAMLASECVVEELEQALFALRKVESV